MSNNGENKRKSADHAAMGQHFRYDVELRMKCRNLFLFVWKLVIGKQLIRYKIMRVPDELTTTDGIEMLGRI